MTASHVASPQQMLAIIITHTYPLKIFLGPYCQEIKPHFSSKGKPGLSSLTLHRQAHQDHHPQGPFKPCLFPAALKAVSFKPLELARAGVQQEEIPWSLLRQGMARPPDSQTRVPTRLLGQWKRGRRGGWHSLPTWSSLPWGKGRPEQSLLPEGFSESLFRSGHGIRKSFPKGKRGPVWRCSFVELAFSVVCLPL